MNLIGQAMTMRFATIHTRHRLSSRDRQGGQALVETIIWSALVLALVPGIVVLFKYAQMRQFSEELLRYTLWERTVWTAPAHPWSGQVHGENRMIQAATQRLVAQGVARLSNPRQAISSTDPSPVDPGMVTPAGRLKPWAVSTAEARLLRLAPDKTGALTGGGSLSADYVRQTWDFPDNRLPAHVLAGHFHIPVLNIDRGLDFNKSLVTASIDTRLKNLYGAWQGLFPLPRYALGSQAGVSIHMHLTGSILTNAWTPKNETVFRKKVHSLDVKPMLGYITYVSSKIDDITSIIPEPLKPFIPFLGPLTQAGNPELHARTAALPYIRAVPIHIDNESGVHGYSAKGP